MAAAGGIVFVLSLAIGWILETRYVTWQREPNPALDRTEPHTVKNLTGYITPGQRELLIWLTRLEMGSGAVILLGLILGSSPGGKRARR